MSEKLVQSITKQTEEELSVYLYARIKFRDFDLNFSMSSYAMAMIINKYVVYLNYVRG